MRKMKFVLRGVIAVFSFYLVIFFAAPAVLASGDKANHVAVFTGVTDHGETDFTLGLEYERRLPMMHGMFGVGLTLERIFGEDYDADIYLLNFIVHPWKGLKINLSPGQESVEAHESQGHRVGSETESLFRYGVAYDFHVGDYSVTPVINIDTVDGETAEVYGIAIGRGF